MPAFTLSELTAHNATSTKTLPKGWSVEEYHANGQPFDASARGPDGTDGARIRLDKTQLKLLTPELCIGLPSKLGLTAVHSIHPVRIGVGNDPGDFLNVSYLRSKLPEAAADLVLLEAELRKLG